MDASIKLYPIGIINKKEEPGTIRIYERYRDALLGLDQFSHIQVFYWFHRNDTSDRRNILQVHPKKNENNPLTGVFATHSPFRPNLIGLSICRIIRIINGDVVIDKIDALDGSPVIDIKSFVPSRIRPSELRMPRWAQI